MQISYITKCQYMCFMKIFCREQKNSWFMNKSLILFAIWAWWPCIALHMALRHSSQCLTRSLIGSLPSFCQPQLVPVHLFSIRSRPSRCGPPMELNFPAYPRNGNEGRRTKSSINIHTPIPLRRFYFSEIKSKAAPPPPPSPPTLEFGLIGFPIGSALAMTAFPIAPRDFRSVTFSW